MLHERDAIRYFALPKINEFLREDYGQETTIVDLRLGIDTTETDEETSMKKLFKLVYMRLTIANHSCLFYWSIDMKQKLIH